LTTNNDDDDWNFSSALPPAAPAKPKEHRATVSETTLRIELYASRKPATANAISLGFAFSNNAASPMSELHFQLAVTKGFELQLNPQSGRDLSPKQSRGITQNVDVWASDRAAKVDAVKLRWRATYKVDGEAKNEMGEIPEFSIA
jgi:ADP-ribosylation factor-binding protein GGA